MLRGISIARRSYHSIENADGRRIVDLLRKRYDQKKLQHIDAAGKDKATILSSNVMHGGTTRVHSHLLKELNNGNDQGQDIGGYGYTSPNEIFINNELNLSKIQVYGFDYDYTLADYTDELSLTIYNSLRDIIVDVLRYPKQIKDLEFDPDFAIRGLHYDVNNGWLMKLDNMANIQLNTVYVGREPIKDIDEIMRFHKGRHIPPNYLKENMFQLSDLFSIPQACLLSDIVQYFRDHDINFHPRYVSDDVNTAARILHTGAHGIGGTLHVEIMKDMSRYLQRNPKLVGYLENLRKKGKKTFLLTNSSNVFISKGMSYLTSSDDWRDLFDCVIVSARKPEFYKSYRPFRRVHEPNWDKVDRFVPGEVYQGGNMKDFAKMTGWTGQKVLYFGDHVFSDLVDASMQHGWHTGAIIHELAKEIGIRNQPSYRHTLSWLLQIEKLLNEAQSWNKDYRLGDLEALITEWKGERKHVRSKLKAAFNHSFGSVFRTYQNPSFFANKIRKFADIYMSNVTNLDRVGLDYVFYPNRTYLPHEKKIEELIDTASEKANEYM